MRKPDVCIREIATQSLLTKSNLPLSDYSVNPYRGCTHGCLYCYARFMTRFSPHSEPWGAFLDVKNAHPILHPEKLAGKELFLSSVTDPYLPEEARFRRTRTLLEQLHGSDIKLTIQTKSDLVLRDLDLIQTFQKARIGFSINTLDETFRDDMVRAVSIERRLNAMKILHDSGISTTCFISPIFPGITDVIAIIERVKTQCNRIWLENLNLRGDYKAVILNYIREKYSALLPLYQAIYQHNSRQYWEDLNQKICAYAVKHKLEYTRNDDGVMSAPDAPPRIVNFFFHEQIKKSVKKTVGPTP